MPPPGSEPRRPFLTPRQRMAAGALTATLALGGGLIKIYEGTVLKAYPDPVLRWRAPTACVGHMDPAMDHDAVFTSEECDELLHSDLRKTYEGMVRCIGDVPLPDHELAGFLSFAFNVGPAKFCASSIPAKLKANDHAAACATLSQYRFVDGHDCGTPAYARVCGGIVRRRSAERSMCEGKMAVVQ